jgi:quinol monooxygenase YgiN
MTTVLIIRIHVKAYDAWRTSFDAHIGFRREHGVTSSEVYCSPEDMTSIAVLATFDSTKAAQAFPASAGFAEALKSGGVIGAPNITVSEVV